MEYAQIRLENLLTIGVDADTVIDYVGEGSNTFESKYEISYSESYFDSSFHLNDSYNYFIFGKFIENDGNNIINEDTSSLILDGYSGVPCLGIIFFNKNIDESKLLLDYLEPLMLHHFIRLLGFNYQVVQKIDGKYTLNIDKYSNVIDSAKKYFGCSNIQNIVLTEEKEGYYSASDENLTLTALYWPKSLFDGELLTKFGFENGWYSSFYGFTLAFLDDLPYLEVKEEYANDFTRFGYNIGCQCNCDYFNSDVYGDDFWDCSVCNEGFFKAIGPGENDKYCEFNRYKDNYFLYNEELKIYKRCDLEINHCQKCLSKTECTLCPKGYKLEDKKGKIICGKDGLTAGDITGILLGLIGFLILVPVIIFIWFMIQIKNKELEEEKEGEIKETEGIPQKKEEEIVPQNKNSEIVDSNNKIINSNVK